MSLFIEGETFFKDDSRFRVYGIPESLRGIRLIRAKRSSLVKFFEMEVNVPVLIHVVHPCGSTFPLEPLEEHMWRAQKSDLILSLIESDESSAATADSHKTEERERRSQQEGNLTSIQTNYGTIGTSPTGKGLSTSHRRTSSATRSTNFSEATELSAQTKLCVMTIVHDGGTIGFKVSSKAPFIIAVGPLNLQKTLCGETGIYCASYECWMVHFT